MAGSPSIFRYEAQFRLPAPPSVVWATIAQVESFESWWSWLRDLRVEGAPLVSGCILSGMVAPPVPYRMRLRVALVRCVPSASIDAEVSGDLEGRAGIRFVPEREGTRATVGWTVEMMQRPMRIAARLGSPVLRWGHDRVVESTVARFQNLLLLQDLSRPTGSSWVGPAAESGPPPGPAAERGRSEGLAQGAPPTRSL